MNVSKTPAFICKKPVLKNHLAARQGFEPRQKEPESFVLPLHYRATEKDNGRQMETSQVENVTCCKFNLGLTKTIIFILKRTPR